MNYGPAELNHDGQMGAFDVALLLSSWGPSLDKCSRTADLDGAAGAFDLATLLGSWGP